MNQPRPNRMPLVAALSGALLLASMLPRPANAEDSPTFFRGINLNGSAVVIDGHAWDSGDARGVVTDGLSAFDKQSVRLLPATDDARSRMIRSSRYARGGKARLRVTGVPAGMYSVYLYVWEDNDPQTFDVLLNGQRVLEKYNSGNGGHWDRLGPWVLDAADGTIELAAIGGHANLSGVEVWRGKLTAKDNPLLGFTPTVAKSSLEADVALILARNCLECHNGSDRKGGLDLTRRERALAGGDSGSAIKPNDLDSLLLRRIDAAEMPPKGREPLSADDRQRLREWIKSGAKWDSDPIDPFLFTSDRRAGYNWWSLQPLKVVEPPRSLNESVVDHFILDRLAKAGLSPSPEADRRTLIRRLTFDLIGLPPTPSEVEDFLNDRHPKAYEKLVDRLLDSPHYGERWARHWLDIVRFGESQGFERNKLRPNVWKYRDFVVEAFNSDLPYDDFIRWQIAGDVLAPENPLAVIASGFLTVGPYDLTAYNNGTPDMRAFAREEELEGLVGAVGQTFLGLTINCSRCHDHKFDPITQREFYQISAALGGTFHGDERESLLEAAKPEVERRISALEAEVEGIRSRHAERDSEVATEVSRREAVIRLLRGGPSHTTAPKQPGAWRVLARGDFKQPGEVVVPRGIAAVTGAVADWKLSESSLEADRRKALAEWIADPNNPLTPRVIVNRLWSYHFGEGLVRTTSDFGFQGGLPSHTELLDWLAGQLVQPAEGPAWSLKRIQRLIVTSAAYKQGLGVRGQGLEKQRNLDADNRLLWHRPAQRLDAEMFRDAVLAISGDLDPKLGGPGFRDFTISSAGNNETYTVFDAIGPEFNRRSLYRTWVRAGTSPLLDTLDCPDPSVPTPRRSVTSTPLQALSLLNDTFIEHYAARFAERLRRDAGDDVAAQVRRAYSLALARQPIAEESKFGERFVGQHGLTQFCVVLFNTNEFLFVD